MTRSRNPGLTPEQAREFARLVKAANHDSGEAACTLGDMFREGCGGRRHSPKQAFRWYARSALAGDAGGQNNLGSCYYHGIGCRQSYGNAVKWYLRAAAQRESTASSNLGHCYLGGYGVPVDKAKALMWFRAAVAQGNEDARKMVDSLAGSNPSAVKPASPDGGCEIRMIDVTEKYLRKGITIVGGVRNRPPDGNPDGK